MTRPFTGCCLKPTQHSLTTSSSSFASFHFQNLTMLLSENLYKSSKEQVSWHIKDEAECFAESFFTIASLEIFLFDLKLFFFLSHGHLSVKISLLFSEELFDCETVAQASRFSSYKKWSKTFPSFTIVVNSSWAWRTRILAWQWEAASLSGKV